MEGRGLCRLGLVAGSFLTNWSQWNGERKPTRVISSRFCGHLGFVTSLVWGGGPPEEWQMLLFFLTGSVSNGSDKSFSSLMGTGLVVALDSTGQISFTQMQESESSNLTGTFSANGRNPLRDTLDGYCVCPADLGRDLSLTSRQLQMLSLDIWGGSPSRHCHRVPVAQAG